MNNTEEIKNILLYDISLLPEGWNLEDLQLGIEQNKTVYYDGSKLKDMAQIPRYINITEKNNTIIKDINNDI